MVGFTLSRTMRPSDYETMSGAVETIRKIQSWVVPPHPYQHEHRTWEQSLAWLAVAQWLTQCHILTYDIRASDWGCGVGMFPAVLIGIGAKVDMFENWKPMYKMTTRAEGDESEFVHRQMAQVAAKSSFRASIGKYEIFSSPMLGELNEQWWKKYHISLCISTLEHIENRERAFEDLCQTIKPGGLLFLTMDYADDGRKDETYIGAQCRSMMYNEIQMNLLAKVASKFGFEFFGGDPDWSWAEEMRMVNDNGFASLVMVRNK